MSMKTNLFRSIAIRLYMNGYTIDEIAKLLHVTRRSICRVVRGYHA